MVKIGENYAFEFLSKSFGVDTMNPTKDASVAALALGAPYTGVTVRDMANAYATFPNNGIYREARTFTKVYDSKGNLVLDNKQEARQILNEKSVTYINYCLVNAANAGTGKGAVFSGQQIAGKTGTTGDSKDRWFCGYTAHYTAAVWSGYDKPMKISLGYNPSSATWKKVMQPLHSGLKRESLYTTSKMVKVSVCLDSGKLATSACSADIRGSRADSAMCYPEDKPKSYCDKHVAKTICSVSNLIATDYCKKFAAENPEIKVGTRSQVKLTSAEMKQIRYAAGRGLAGIHAGMSYVLSNKTCDVHTHESWMAYLKEKEEQMQPTDPSVPAETTPATP